MSHFYYRTKDGRIDFVKYRNLINFDQSRLDHIYIFRDDGLEIPDEYDIGQRGVSGHLYNLIEILKFSDKGYILNLPCDLRNTPLILKSYNNLPEGGIYLSTPQLIKFLWFSPIPPDNLHSDCPVPYTSLMVMRPREFWKVFYVVGVLDEMQGLWMTINIGLISISAFFEHLQRQIHRGNQLADHRLDRLSEQLTSFS